MTFVCIWQTIYKPFSLQYIQAIQLKPFVHDHGIKPMTLGHENIIQFLIYMSFSILYKYIFTN